MAEEVLVNIRFQLTGERAVKHAVKRLSELQGLQTRAVKTTKVLTDEGWKSAVTLQAGGRMSTEAFEAQQKQIESAVRRIGRYKSVTAGTYTTTKKLVPVIGETTDSFTRLSTAARRLRGAAWTVTWAAMSMLGVYFGGISVIREFRRATELLLRPLSDLGRAAETLAKAYAYGLMTGLGPFASGLLDLDSILAKLPEAYMNFTALMEGAKALLIAFAVELFTNKEFVSALNEVLCDLAALLPDLTRLLIPLLTGFLHVAHALLMNKDTIFSCIEAWRDFMSHILTVYSSVLRVIAPFIGLGGVMETMAGAVAAQTDPWARFGAQLGTVTIGMAALSYTAMILLPFLSTFQVLILAASFATYALAGATKFLNIMQTHHWFILTAVGRAQLRSILYSKWQALMAFKAAVAAKVAAAATWLWNFALQHTILLIGILTGGLLLLLGLLAVWKARATTVPTGAAGAAGPTTTTIYQNVTIGTVEKTADVDEVVDRLAEESRGRYR